MHSDGDRVRGFTRCHPSLRSTMCAFNTSTWGGGEKRLKLYIYPVCSCLFVRASADACSGSHWRSCWCLGDDRWRKGVPRRLHFHNDSFSPRWKAALPTSPKCVFSHRGARTGMCTARRQSWKSSSCVYTTKQMEVEGNNAICWHDRARSVYPEDTCLSSWKVRNRNKEHSLQQENKNVLSFFSGATSFTKKCPGVVVVVFFISPFLFAYRLEMEAHAQWSWSARWFRAAEPDARKIWGRNANRGAMQNTDPGETCWWGSCTGGFLPAAAQSEKLLAPSRGARMLHSPGSGRRIQLMTIDFYYSKMARNNMSQVRLVGKTSFYAPPL